MIIKPRNILLFVVLIVAVTYATLPGKRQMLELLMESGKLDLAYELVRKTGKSDEDFSMLVTIADIYERKGETDRAVEALEKAIELHPSNLTALEKIVRFLIWSQRDKEALPYLERTLLVTPNDVGVLRQLMELYAKHGMEPEASSAMARYILVAGSLEADVGMQVRGESESKFPDLVRPVLKQLAAEHLEQGPDVLRDQAMQGIFVLLQDHLEKVKEGQPPDPFEQRSLVLEQFVVAGQFDKAEELARAWDEKLRAEHAHRERYGLLLVWNGVPEMGAEYLMALAEEGEPNMKLYSAAFEASLAVKDFELVERCLAALSDSDSTGVNLRQVANLQSLIGRNAEAAKIYMDLVASGQADEKELGRMLKLAIWSDDATVIREAAELAERESAMSTSTRELVAESWLAVSEPERAFPHIDTLFRTSGKLGYAMDMLDAAGYANNMALVEKALGNLLDATASGSEISLKDASPEELERVLQLSLWSENATLIRRGAEIVEGRERLDQDMRELVAESWLAVSEPERAFPQFEALYQSSGKPRFMQRMLDAADYSANPEFTAHAIDRVLRKDPEGRLPFSEKTAEADYDRVLQMALWSENATLIRRGAEIIEKQETVPAETRDLLAQAWLALNEPAQAYSQLTVLYETSGEQGYILRMLDVAESTNDQKLKQTILDNVLAELPNDLGLLRRAANDYIDADRLAPALPLLRHVAHEGGAVEDCLAYLDVAVNLNDESAVFDAVRVAEQARRQLKPGSEQAQELHRSIAEAYGSIGRDSNRADQLARYSDEHPYDYKAALAAAEAADGDGQTELAIRLYERARDLSPTSAMVRLLLAERYMWAGREGDAALEYVNLEQLDELPPEGRLVLGRGAFEHELWAESLRYLEPLLLEGKLERFDAFLVAMALDRVGRPVDAEAAYLRLAEAHSGDADFLAELGSEAYFTGAMKRAVLIFLKALEVAPGQPVALKGLGMAYQALGEKQSAMEALKWYLQGRPNDPEARYLLAGLYENLGMTESASQEYRATLDILYSEYTGGGS